MSRWIYYYKDTSASSGVGGADYYDDFTGDDSGNFTYDYSADLGTNSGSFLFILKGVCKDF